jgi:N-acyl-D-aspartate/D-glutamate deacylase
MAPSSYESRKGDRRMAMYDLVIRNARIADGLGGELIDGDLAAKDGRIAAIGKVESRGAEEVDANGQVLAPGVIDVHTHYDAQLTWDSTASPSPALGVTTVVIGNCGFGIAPATPDMRDTILKNLSEVEAMSLDSLRAGVDWGFESFGEYLDLLERKGVYPNVAAYASHSAIRTCVMKDEGSQREATTDEIERMVALFRDAMESGAFGLGSSTFENHNGFGGVPVPSRLASDDEFRAFARALKDYGHGSIMATCGNRTTIPFLEELSAISGRPVVYAPLLYYSRSPDRARNITRQCAEARGRGRPVYAQASCQPLSMDFVLTHPYPMLTIDGWPGFSEPERLKTVFADKAFRDRVREDLKEPKGTRIFNGQWHLVEVTISADPKLEGRSIAEIAQERGQDPVECFLDIGLAEDLKTTFTAKLLNVEEDKVAELLRSDGNMVSLSDAGAHHTFFCDAGFGMYFLGHWVRERKLFALPDAIRKLSGDLADIYGIPDRGVLKVGAWADVILFDPDEISVSKPFRVSDLPANGVRLTRQAPGLKGTWVNGVKVFDGAGYVQTKAPGKVLRSFVASKPTVGMPKPQAAAAE